MSENRMHEIKLDELENVTGGIALKDLDPPHRNMLDFLMQKLDRQSFEDLLRGIENASDIDEARRLIELPYGVQAGH